ncbi:hypothetical protein ABZV34_27015 [Streptomyces sp. NPDC005195]|uniref:hypothetical protein n=1 Tax=Streptomyces sp. NPDC005195 TaxID=3154561 RepID=UPI0033BB43FB
MPTSGYAFTWTSQPFDEDEAAPASLLLTVAQGAVTLLGDQWSAAEGPAGRTGHVRSGSRDVFTIGVCEAGAVFLRNDGTGDVMHLPHTDAESDVDAIAEQVAEYIGHLY